MRYLIYQKNYLHVFVSVSLESLSKRLLDKKVSSDQLWGIDEFREWREKEYGELKEQKRFRVTNYGPALEKGYKNIQKNTQSYNDSPSLRV